jgi:hypothetical protein
VIKRAAAAAAAALLGGGCGGSALSTSRPPRAISPAAHTVLTGCLGHLEMHPAELVLACGDAGDILTRMRWSRWGGATATATGAEVVAICSPSCVAGTTATFPVTVTVAGLALQGTDAAYRSLTVTGHGKLPAGVARVTRYALGSAGPLVQTGG